MVLGEVSLESGELSCESSLSLRLYCSAPLDLYERGVEDFTTCLQLREAVLDPTDRRLAEA